MPQGPAPWGLLGRSRKLLGGPRSSRTAAADHRPSRPESPWPAGLVKRALLAGTNRSIGIALCWPCRPAGRHAIGGHTQDHRDNGAWRIAMIRSDPAINATVMVYLWERLTPVFYPKFGKSLQERPHLCVHLLDSIGPSLHRKASCCHVSTTAFLTACHPACPPGAGFKIPTSARPVSVWRPSCSGQRPPPAAAQKQQQRWPVAACACGPAGFIE